MFFCNAVFADPAVIKKPHKKEPPTRITSDIIDIKRKSQIMEFIGHVVVKKGLDTMLAERMLVFYEDDKNSEMKSFNGAPAANQPAKKSAIKRIEAEQNVRVFSTDMVATGDSGYYDPQADIFVLEQNVVVNNGSSVGHGDKFVYSLKTQKGNFVGNKTEESSNVIDNRVIFVISNDDLKSGGKKKDTPKVKKENNEPKKESDE